MNNSKYIKDRITEKELYQTAFESSSSGILVVDGGDCILRVNEAGERMFGYDAGELRNTKIDALFTKVFKKASHRWITKPASEYIQVSGIRNDGSEFPLDIRIVTRVIEGQTVATLFCRPADRSLIEIDSKMHTLIGNLSGIAYRCTADIPWRMEFVSNACKDISGYKPEQICGNGNLNWDNLIHPEDRERVLTKVKEAISKRKSYQLFYRILTAEKKMKWIWDQGFGVRDENGKVRSLEGFMQDITRLKETESALEQEKESLHRYLDTAASIFLVINKNHTVELVNKKGCEILGCAEEKIIGKNWFRTFMPGDEQHATIALFDAIMKGRTEPPDFYENVILTCKGRRRLIRWRNATLNNGKNEITGLISSGFDVTEQKMTEQELRASEEKNRAILEALPDLIFVHDKKATVLQANVSEPAELLLPKEQLIGKTVGEILPPEPSRIITKAIAKAQRSKKMVIKEVEVPVKGEKTIYETRFVPFDADKILTIARNISKQKEIQDGLHLKNRALGAAGNGIVIADAQLPDLPIIYCNKAFSRITGYRQSEVLGKNCRILQNDDRDQDEIKTLALAIQNGEPCRVTLRNYRKDNTLFWNELTITPLYDKGQKLTHFIGVQNDVTEMQRAKKQLEEYANKLEEKVAKRTKEIESTVQKLVAANLTLEDQVQETKLAENKAQRSQALFSAIARNFPRGLIVVFNSDFELTYIDGEELTRLVLNKSDYTGRRIDDISILSKNQIEGIKKDIQKTLAGQSLSFEVEFKKNSYSANSTPLFSNGNKIVWALFVFHNITVQKQVQEGLAKALRTERELNDLKSRFISMASHEFRTPLSAILSSAILIGKQNEPGKEGRRIKHVQRIRHNVKNLVVILNDFLSLSKLEEGKVSASPQSFELIQFSKLLVEEMESNKKKGQRIHMTHPNGEIMVYLDPKLLSHILINLLSNAMKYSDENQNIGFEIAPKGGTLIFKISDMGIGIPKEEQIKLFERFFRAANATNIQGTGLGLHIVKQYTELMQGTVSFTSKPGKGSTFTVQLPLNLDENEKSIVD